MSLNVKLLSLLLVLQLGVSFFLFSSDDKLNNFEPNSSFISLDKKDLTKLSLINVKTDKDQRELEEVSLIKEDSIWKVKIKDNVNFKADQDKVSKLLASLKNIKKPLPTSTNKSSHSKLKVSANNFEKKISLNIKDKSKELLIGSDSGFKEVYIRDKEDVNTYSVKFDAASLNFDPQKFIDTEYLKLNSKGITELNLGSLNFEKVNKEYKLKEEKETNLNQQKVSSIFKSISNLNIESLVFEDKTKLKNPLKSFTLKVADKDLTYSFFENNDTNYNLVVSSSDYVFSVLKAPIDKIFEFKKDELLEDKLEADKEASVIEANPS